MKRVFSFVVLCAVLALIGCAKDPSIRINSFEIKNDTGINNIIPGASLTAVFVVEISNLEGYSRVESSGMECDVQITTTKGLKLSDNTWKVNFVSDEARTRIFYVTIPDTASDGSEYKMHIVARLPNDSQSEADLTMIVGLPEAKIEVANYGISGGDRDGKISPGEKYAHMNLWLKNTGVSASGSITTTLSTNDSLVTVYASERTFSFSDLAAGKTTNLK